MKLYDEIINDINKQLASLEGKKLNCTEDADWPDVGKAKMILRSEMAYELGSNHLPAVGNTIVTTSEELVPTDEIVLYGDDLSEIKEDRAYARIALVRVNDENMGEGDKLYNAIHRIEYFRYHIYPDGFMMRVSAANDKESVRVGTEAIERGLSFEKIGNVMIKALHLHKDVEAAKIIFVTLPDAPYKELEESQKKTKQITNTIDHMLKDVNMDCGSCNLQEICDEVEGMKELHFGISNQE